MAQAFGYRPVRLVDELFGPIRRTFEIRGRAARAELDRFAMLYGFVLFLLRTLTAEAGILSPFRLYRSTGDYVTDAALLLIAFLPFFALFARRLHDIGVIGWPALFLLGGLLVLIQWRDWHFAHPDRFAPLPPGSEALGYALATAVFAIALWPSQRGPNRFGPDPREAADTGAAPEPA